MGIRKVETEADMNAITLLTDFGTSDGYVAEVKGVLFSLAPQARILDLAHDLAPQDIMAARLAVARYWRRFPPGTVHMVVVDPGVGTERAALAVTSEGRMLVGPDNGVLSPALFSLDAEVVRLDVPADAAPTFHGRDVFAPAAAALAGGTDLAALGEPFTGALRLRTPSPRHQSDRSVLGEVLTVDRFGNIITNLRPAGGGGSVELGGLRVELARSYGHVPRASMLALIGSSGFVEIALREGNAARELGAARGMPVLWRPDPKPRG